MEASVSQKKQLIIVVTGCTGTGKTKLGIELAKKFNGEVISADSMQIYQGLDIISNTVTNEEMDGVAHHCINFVPPSEQFNVSNYVEYTIPIIQKIIKHGKVPIIVGGTAYYIEALLWDFTLTFKDAIASDAPSFDQSDEILNSDEMNDYEKLQQLDPLTAEKLHPHDKRKIRRSLEIFQNHGCSQSSLLSDQHVNEHDKRGCLRWDAVLLFSMECSFEVLDVRLDKRVDEMVKLGLCSELQTFCHENFSHDSGLLSQVIGYKEFQKYIELFKKGDADESILVDALTEGLNKMKVATRRYARKQIRWVKHRLAQDTSNYKFIRLDTSNPDQWDEEISKPAHEAVSSFIAGTLQFSSNSETIEVCSNKTSHSCNICDVICMGEDSFSAHTKSRRHRRKKAYFKRKPLIDQIIASKK